MPFLIIFAFVAFIIVAAVLSHQASQKRREMLFAWAAARGCSFSAEKDKSFEGRHPFFKTLQQGSNRYACNIITGQWDGRGFEAFDYHYETHSTNSKGQSTTDHHYLSAVVIASPFALKPLIIRTENFFDKVGQFFGHDDINFESAEFSKRFHVKSPDRKWAFDVLHQRTIQMLLDSPRFRIEFTPMHVIAWRGGLFKHTADFEQAAGLACGMLNALPEYVVRQQSQA